MQQRRILVVDDDPDVQLAVRARLLASGFDVDTADDGRGAYAAASSESPDLILLDIRLPGEDGFEVLARLKQTAGLAAIPVIMMSAQDPETTEQRALESGASAYCCKPFNSSELLDAIAGALER